MDLESVILSGISQTEKDRYMLPLIKSESCSVMSDSLWVKHSPGQNIGMGSLSLLQEIFPTQGQNPGLLHCRCILYQLSHQGSPRILEWAAYPFSSRSSWPKNRTGVSCITGRLFTSWASKQNLKRKKLIQTNLFTKETQTHRLNKLMVTRGKEFGGGTDWEFGTDMYTLVNLKQITSKDLMCSTRNSAQYRVIV